MPTPVPVEIGVCSEYSAEALRKVIRQIEPLTADDGTMVEKLEKKELKRRYGWKQPRGLTCYSKFSTYRDLYVYFDYADTTSDINVAATTSFKCYGLDGAQKGNLWDSIHGKCVAVRSEPPSAMTIYTTIRKANFNDQNFDYNPILTVDEMVETLMFFKGLNAAEIARCRDIERSMGKMTVSDAGLGGVTMYMRPGAAPREITKDIQRCSVCGISKGMAGKMMICPCHQSGVAYCGRDCQKKDWPTHKLVCSQRKM